MDLGEQKQQRQNQSNKNTLEWMGTKIASKDSTLLFHIYNTISSHVQMFA